MMLTSRMTLAALLLVALIAHAKMCPVASAQRVAARPTPTVSSSASSPGMQALGQATAANRYLFLFLWKDNSDATQRAYAAFQHASASVSLAADVVAVRADDPRERPLVEKFGLTRAPLPMVLAVAANGAVTKAIVGQIDEQQFQEALVSPGTACCLKAFQERKLAIVCVLNQRSQFAEAAWQGVQQFKADPKFGAATEVVTIDPADHRETSLLHSLKVDPSSPQATTVVLAPSGQAIAKFAGPVTRDQIVTKVSTAQSGCCPGGSCGPGGCGPKK